MTGQVYGVGEETVLVYARHAAVVTCVDIDLNAASSTSELIRNQDGRASALGSVPE